MATRRSSLSASQGVRAEQPVPVGGFLWLDVAPRVGLNREEAGHFIGVSPSKFDELVRDGRMPRPRRIDNRVVWDVRQLLRAFSNLPGGEEDEQNPWNDSPSVLGARR